MHVVHEGTVFDPHFTVHDNHTGAHHHALGKYLTPTRESSSPVTVASMSPPRKRAAPTHHSPPVIQPILTSIRDIGEYYSALEATAAVHIVEGSIPEKHKASVARLVQKIMQRFETCSYSTYDAFVRCLLPSDRQHRLGKVNGEDAHVIDEQDKLRESCMGGLIRFIFIFGESLEHFHQLQLPPSWITPTLGLPAMSERMGDPFETGMLGRTSNLIIWADGCLRHRCSVITKYWG